MKKILEVPSSEVLSHFFTYDPISGKLFWVERPREHFKTEGGWRRFNRNMAGREAGHRHNQNNGKPHAIVVRVTVNEKDSWFLAHRLIFSIMGVVVPDGLEIDHKDTNPWNNAWTNLRLATPSQNQANKSAGSNNRPSGMTHLPKGVSIQLGRYKAQISFAGKKEHIGMYATPEEASEAYQLRAKELNGEFARWRVRAIELI